MEQIRWVEPFAYTAGKPFRVFPLGEFKRGQRTLDLTPERLQQMAANYEAGRPRWQIPLYFGHPTPEQPDPPKAGNVKRLYYVDGDGLYAEPEYTEDGARAVDGGQYQYISPGVLWSLNGSEYADEHGKPHDNVIEHVALTNRPFFGGRTAVFSADAEVLEAEKAERSRRHNGYTKLREVMRQRFEELLSMFKDEDGDGVPDAAQVPPVTEHQPPVVAQEAPAAQAQPEAASEAQVVLATLPENTTITITQSPAPEPPADEYRDYDAAQRKAMAEAGEAMPDGAFPIKDKIDLRAAIQSIGRAGNPAAARAHIRRRARELEALDMLPADWPGSEKETEKMDDETTVTTQPPAEPENMSEIRAKAEQAEALSVQVADLKAQAETFAAQLKAERETRRREQLLAQYAETAADKPEVLAEKFMALEQVNPELAEYFAGRIAHLENLAKQAGLFSQFASGRDGGVPDTFTALVEKVLADEFAGDRTKYAQAYRKAGVINPDLAAAYARRAA